MTVSELVVSLKDFKEIKGIFIHFIDGAQCHFVELSYEELKLEVLSFQWVKAREDLHIYVEEVK